MNRKQKKNLLDQYLEDKKHNKVIEEDFDEPNSSELLNDESTNLINAEFVVYAEDGEVVEYIEEGNDISKIKFKANIKRFKMNKSKVMIATVIIFFILMNVSFFYFIYVRASNNIDNQKLTEEEILVLNSENQKAIDSATKKLIEEIGVEQSEIDEIIEASKIGDEQILIRTLENKYTNLKTKYDEEITTLNNTCDVMQLTCKVEGTLVSQIEQLNKIIEAEQKRLEEIAKQQEAERLAAGQTQNTQQQNQEVNQASNNNEPQNVSTPTTSSSQDKKETEEEKKCFNTYDEAYQSALDEFLSDDSIGKFTIDSNNCPRFQ